MAVSIVIPSKNRQSEILVCLNSIVAQPTLPYEIVIVDQSSEPYVLPEIPGLKHVYRPALSGLTAARNVGIDIASGDIALFLDDDATVEGDVVAAIERRFEREPDLVGGACRFLNYDRPLSRNEVFHIIFERGYFNARAIRRKHCTELRTAAGGGMAIRTEVARRLRWDESLIGYCMGEDFEFSQRARKYGRLVRFDDAPLRHEGSTVNRLNREITYRWRWRNFGRFFRASSASKTPLGWITYRWWQLGEIIRWMRFGLGNPARLLVDPSPPAAPTSPTIPAAQTMTTN